jgi:hypothetical protein
MRPPDQVMRLERMGSFFPTRLSFMRSLIRTLTTEAAEVTRPVWEMDAEGFGRAVYSVELSGHTYSLAAFSAELDPNDRTDRVIAEAWDAAFVLFDGVPTVDDLDRLATNAPYQEAGRFLPSDLVLSRANKSVRLFEHVAQSLAQGEQPDSEMVGSIGYLMRTTAVYGNGKFGIADRARLVDRPGMDHPFRAEMLTVWMIRGFTHDLVEHVARNLSPATFAPLSANTKRFLGIGNSTGLGMAPFLVSHPILINNWMMARETALQRVRDVELASESEIDRVLELIARAQRHCEEWNVEDRRQMDRVVQLRLDLTELSEIATKERLSQPSPWERLVVESERFSIECQELVVALVLEPYGELIDGLADCMASTITARLDPRLTVGQLTDAVEANFDWALEIDFDSIAESCQFWYVSEEKLEPRLGMRYEEPGAELEQPLDIARRVKSLSASLKKVNPKITIAEFLVDYPEHRFAVRRVQTLQRHPYAEIRDNLIGEQCLPIDMLRCKLSFFGAAKFDPKSDRWTRITMYQGAPLSSDVAEDKHKGSDKNRRHTDDWWLPVQAS